MINKSTSYITFVLTILILVVVSNKHTSAGVISVNNGVITTATLTVGGQQQLVNFTNDSYNNLKSDPESDNMPWHLQAPLAAALANDLVVKIGNQGTALDTNNYYLFVVGYDNAQQEFILSGVFYNPEQQAWASSGLVPIAFNPNDNQHTTSLGTFYLYYATANTSNSDSNVPEPSTAIAMGLLGIVGFAGNRRRRRQESVA